MTKEQRAQNIQQACREYGIEGHIEWIKRKQKLPWQKRTALTLNYEERGAFPVKNCYMFCDTLDMCFFYDSEDVPYMTYSGYASIYGNDITKGTLIKSFEVAKQILNRMEELAEEYEVENDKN